MENIINTIAGTFTILGTLIAAITIIAESIASAKSKKSLTFYIKSIRLIEDVSNVGKKYKIEGILHGRTESNTISLKLTGGQWDNSTISCKLKRHKGTKNNEYDHDLGPDIAVKKINDNEIQFEIPEMSGRDCYQLSGEYRAKYDFSYKRMEVSKGSKPKTIVPIRKQPNIRMKWLLFYLAVSIISIAMMYYLAKIGFNCMVGNYWSTFSNSIYTVSLFITVAFITLFNLIVIIRGIISLFTLLRMSKLGLLIIPEHNKTPITEKKLLGQTIEYMTGTELIDNRL